MKFIFISANFPENYWQFCKGLKNNGVQVYGIADVLWGNLSTELKDSFADYYYVPDMEVYDDVYKGVAFFCSKYGKVDGLESNNEYWLERDASLRTDFNIPGLNEKTIEGIRYKSKMKKFYEKAGCKVARYHMVSTLKKGIKFIEEVGYPVIVKPDNGMGAVDTFKISNQEELSAFYQQSYPTQMIMEEFVYGELLSYDGIANSKKEILFESVNEYPVPIMNIVNEQRDAYFYSMKDIDPKIREIGQSVVKSFDTNSRFFHCEYFRLLEDKEGLGKKGDIIGLEVNMRPPGGNAPDMMNYARDIDVYQIWADMISKDATDYDLNCPSRHCVFVSRRDASDYVKSLEEIEQMYSTSIVFNQRGPEALAQAMGDHILIARFDAMDDVNRFIDDVSKRV